MPKSISLISGKGGVGKTTVAANLGAALSLLGKETVIIDGNLTTPNLSIHLGIPLYPVTLHDVLRGSAPLESAVYRHHTGLKVVPASISANSLRGIKPERLREVVSSLLDAEFVIVDGAAGLGKEALAAATSSEKALIVTNPEVTAVTDALKTVRTIEGTTDILGVVVNRVGKKSHEMKLEEIESILDYPVLATVPEDENVQKAISMKVPVIHYAPKSAAAKKFKKLAEKISGVKPRKRSFLDILFRRK
ncbi:MAG: P-loop NTPase [Candidatus Micrarchaeota archaeon]|nr:P-loop NTPase [Candidatus Micrarchaeota archaeon]